MPTRLSRYILGDILRIFAVSLVSLTALILLIGVGRELVRQGLGPLAVVQLLPFVLPISLQFAFPATALFAVCSVYGRMSADGEVGMVKASGISPLRLLKPALLFALVLSPIAVVVSDLAVSWGAPGINRVVLTSIEDIAYRVLRSRHSYTSDHGFSIHVRDVVGKTLVHPTVTIQGGGGRVKLTAREGELTLDENREMLVLRVLDSQIEGGALFQSVIPGVNEFPIPIGDINDKNVADRRPSELPLTLIAGERARVREQVRGGVGRIAAARTAALLTSRIEDADGGDEERYRHRLKHDRKRELRLGIEPWRRWAWGFSCLGFVVVGAPLAMLRRTGDAWTTFGICFLPTLLVYYPLFILGLEQAKDAVFPPGGVWLGNGVMAVAGLALVHRVWRY